MIPNREFTEHPDWVVLMQMAHNKFVNSDDEYNEGMAFLCAALTAFEHIDNDDYFDGSSIKMKSEWRCVLDKYKVASEDRIQFAHITEVIVSGFYM